MFGPQCLSVGLLAGKKGRLAMEQNSKSGLGGCEVGLLGWPTPPRGDRTSKFGCSIHELRTGMVKFKGRTSEGKGRTSEGKDNDEQGQ